MASIYKRTRSYPIPSGAKITERKRKATPEELRSNPTQATIIERYASWTDGKGRQRRGLLDDSGQRVTVEATTYTIAYWLNNERVEVNSGTPDRDAAQQLANKLETEAMLRARGIIDATQERYSKQAQRTIKEHLADFRADLAGKEGTPHHVSTTCRHIETIVNGCGIEAVHEIDAAAVMRVIGTLRDRPKKPASLRTCNAFLRSIKSFTRWLRNERRQADDALAKLSGFNETTDRRHERRELQPEEVRLLLATVDADPRLNYKLPGTVRAMAYTAGPWDWVSSE